MRIGAFSGITGILVETIRYYEQKGLLSPQRDSENSYRNYDIEDLVDILRVKQFRSLEFSIPQITENIVNGKANPEQLAVLLHEKKELYEAEIASLKDKMSRISLFEYYLQQEPGIVKPNYVPAVYRLILSDPAVLGCPGASDIIKRWMTYQPYTHLTICLSKQSLLDNSSPYLYPDIGIGLLKRYFDQYNETLIDPITRTPPSNVVSLTIVTEEIKRIPRSKIQPILKYAKEHGYVVQDHVYGLVYYVQGTQDNKRYYITIHLCI